MFSAIFAQVKDDEIHACANKRSGELRVITEYKDYKEGRREKERRTNNEDKDGCRPGEISLSWNIQGPPGPQGPAGSGSGSGLPFICPACEIESQAGDLLSGKDLSRAILYKAVLDGANLSNTNFTGATLERATLNGSNLSNANFENATLRDAETSDTNWDGVIWKNTICPDGSNSDGNGGSCNDHLTPNQE